MVRHPAAEVLKCSLMLFPRQGWIRHYNLESLTEPRKNPGPQNRIDFCNLFPGNSEAFQVDIFPELKHRLRHIWILGPGSFLKRLGKHAFLKRRAGVDIFDVIPGHLEGSLRQFQGLFLQICICQKLKRTYFLHVFLVCLECFGQCGEDWELEEVVDIELDPCFMSQRDNLHGHK